MRSLRARLLLGTATATGLLLAASGVLIYVGVRAALLAEFDSSLLTQARALAAATEWHGDRLELEQEAVKMPEFQSTVRRHGGAEYYQVWTADGAVAARSSSLGQEHSLPQLSPATGRDKTQPLNLPDGRAGRAIALTFHANREAGASEADEQRGAAVTLVLARDTAEVDRALARIRNLLIGVFAGVTLLAVALMSIVVRRGLRPLGTLAARIDAFGHEHLSERIILRDTPQELRPVVDRLNEMLGRVEAAVVRERSFSADVAHELRTPLAGLETALEVCTTRDRQPQEYAAVARQCLKTTRATRGMVETLLVLARADAQQLKVSPQPIELAPLLRECWSRCSARAAERELRVEWRVAPTCVVHTDPTQLALVINNLLDNAVTYADPGGRIDVAASCPDGQATIEIRNSGSALSREQLAQVFDRFWRGDESRAGNGVHCGLGLALCRKIVSLLSGTIAVESVDGVFSVRLAFPR